MNKQKKHSCLPKSLHNRCCSCLASIDDTRRFPSGKQLPQSVLSLCDKANKVSGPLKKKPGRNPKGYNQTHVSLWMHRVTGPKITPLQEMSGKGASVPLVL